MFVFGNLLAAAGHVINAVLTVYMWIIIIRALISWVSPDPYNPIVRFLYAVTEPVLYRVRRALPMTAGIDFSPMIVIFAILFLKYFLVQTLIDAARRLR